MRTLPLVLVVLALSGCSDAVDTAERARDCVALARDVAATGLGQVPSRAQAEEAAQRLDERVGRLTDPEVREAATALRDRLQELAEAARRGDAARTSAAAAEARQAARATADACSLPAGEFL